MLTLSKRACTLGDDYSGKGKDPKVGGEKIRTLTFQIAGVLLDDRELNALLGEPHAWRSLYNQTADGVIPFLRCFKSLEFKDAFEQASVTLTYGIDNTAMAFNDCKLSKLKLELLNGGDTQLSCKVTTAPILDETLAELFEQFGKSVECELRADLPHAQTELPLSSVGQGEQPAEKRKRGRPRKNNGEQRAH